MTVSSRIDSTGPRLIVAVLALYRASGFIHELTHIRQGALPGFRFAWNLLVGIPLLLPSFMYEGVHTQHHAKTRYGTADDPEYLPLALMKPWSLPLFIVTAVLEPVALLLRFGVLTPLSLLVPPLRRIVVERASALSINPDYRRRTPEGAFARMWAWQEAGASLWAIALLEFKTQKPIFGRLFATLTQHQLAPIGEDEEGGGHLVGDLVDFTVQAARVSSSLGSALADNIVTPKEAQATLDLIVVPIEQDPIEIGRMRANAVFGALALFLLDPAGIDQPFKGPLHRCARATDFLRHPDLAADAPALIVDVAAEQAQHLQIARFEGGIRDGAGRDDR